jgi:hypothetical protein
VRSLLILAALASWGCASTGYAIGQPRSGVLRDVEGYAIASCLVSQSESYLRDQGDGWASVIVQRMKGDIDALSGVTGQVKVELAKGNMAVIRAESPPGDRALPLLYCCEIIDAPAVRTAIEKAVGALGSAYEEDSASQR